MKPHPFIVAGLVAALSAGAQNKAPRAASTNPPATTNAAATAATNAADSVTGVPRYHAGFRGPASTPAPATPGELSRVGDDRAIDADSVRLAVAGFRNNSLGIAAGTPITVRLKDTVDSGHVKNGQTIRAMLVNAVPGAPAGSDVELSVVSSAAAGQMNSAGELSIQIVRINGSEALSQVITAQGKQGAALTADGAPARGTEAQLGPDQPLVLPAA